MTYQFREVKPFILHLKFNSLNPSSCCCLYVFFCNLALAQLVLDCKRCCRRFHGPPHSQQSFTFDTAGLHAFCFVFCRVLPQMNLHESTLLVSCSRNSALFSQYFAIANFPQFSPNSPCHAPMCYYCFRRSFRSSSSLTAQRISKQERNSQTHNPPQYSSIHCS